MAYGDRGSAAVEGRGWLGFATTGFARLLRDLKTEAQKL
jgi:hypothetical protein